MRVQDPMVRAQVEQVTVGNRLAVARLNFSLLCPISHAWLQLKIVIHCIVVEFFLLNFLARLLEILIHPVQDVKAANRSLQQVNIDNAGHNIYCHIALQLHYVLMQLF
jgi:hypothetical protein